MAKNKRNPITGQTVVPADLLADAQKGTPWENLTDAERAEYKQLTPALQRKISGIAVAALIGAAGLDPKDDSVSSDDASAFLNSMMDGDQKQVA